MKMTRYAESVLANSPYQREPGEALGRVCLAKTRRRILRIVGECRSYLAIAGMIALVRYIEGGVQ
jgi:hypothetical protein